MTITQETGATTVIIVVAGTIRTANGLLEASSGLQLLRPSPTLIVAIATTDVAGVIAIDPPPAVIVKGSRRKLGLFLMRHRRDEVAVTRQVIV